MFGEEYQEGIVMAGRFQSDGTPIGSPSQVSTVFSPVQALPAGDSD